MVAGERLKSPRARLFVAIDLPGAVRERISAWGEEELRDPALRVVPRESLHITLAFLGYVAEREVGRLGEIIAAGGDRAVRIELRDPVARPARGRPRLFALPAESAAAVELQAELQERLVEARLYKPEKRPFWPHITVARVRRPKAGSGPPPALSGPRLPLPKDLLQPFGGVRVTLYRSELQPWGAQYTSLAQVELPEEGRQ